MRTHMDSDTKNRKKLDKLPISVSANNFLGVISTIDMNQKIGRRRNNLCGFRIPADKVFMIASF